MMRTSGFILSTSSHAGEQTFRDGSRLYRFATREELQASLDEFMTSDKVTIDGSEEHITMAALSAAPEDPEIPSIHPIQIKKKMPKVVRSSPMSILVACPRSHRPCLASSSTRDSSLPSFVPRLSRSLTLATIRTI